MTTGPAFIAVDWGTTRMRALLCHQNDASCRDGGEVVTGPGIGQLTRSIPETLFDAIQPWVRQHGKLDLILAGMVGSNLGWRVAPYVQCPVSFDQLYDQRLVFEDRGHSISIVPGATCENSLGQADVMRGEEIQLLGWAKRRRRQGNCLVCLPGTHTKWASVIDGELRSFTTSLTGEVYGLLRHHSVLVPREDVTSPRPFDQASFFHGVELIRSRSNRLLHALFSTRSRSLMEPGVVADQSSYLSGLLIASDIDCALGAYAPTGSHVQLIGDQYLCRKFALALEAFGLQSETWDGIEAVRAGFTALVQMGSGQ